MFEVYTALEEGRTLTDDGRRTDKDVIKDHLRAYSAEWGIAKTKFKLTPYILGDSKPGSIVSSWFKEYAIFNLVHILHTFDWDNDYLIYSGW